MRWRWVKWRGAQLLDLDYILIHIKYRLQPVRNKSLDDCNPNGRFDMALCRGVPSVLRAMMDLLLQMTLSWINFPSFCYFNVPINLLVWTGLNLYSWFLMIIISLYYTILYSLLKVVLAVVRARKIWPRCGCRMLAEGPEMLRGRRYLLRSRGSSRREGARFCKRNLPVLVGKWWKMGYPVGRSVDIIWWWVKTLVPSEP